MPTSKPPFWPGAPDCYWIWYWEKQKNDSLFNMETQILLSAEVTASGASNELVSNGKGSTNFYVCACWPSRWSSSSLLPSASSSSPSCRLAIQRLRGAVNAFGRSIYTACRPDQHPLRHLYSPNNASINFHAYTHARIRTFPLLAVCL